MTLSAEFVEEKQILRASYLEIRNNLSLERRREASQGVVNWFLGFFSDEVDVLSFVSFSSELDTTPLNTMLAKKGRLLIPCINGERLFFCRVGDLSTSLSKHPWGFMQPSTELEEPLHSLKAIVLVPGLAFDTVGQRLGYGKGCYDYFLSLHPSLPTYGIGFKEQLHTNPLPVAAHDVPLSRVFLF